MSYTLQLERIAQRQLAKIDKLYFDAINEKIIALKTNPRPPGCKKLEGRDAWRIRIGDYSVVYEINDGILLVLVIEIGHRKNIYKKR
jgi:mRNA interferase RelE/StbE